MYGKVGVVYGTSSLMTVPACLSREYGLPRHCMASLLIMTYSRSTLLHSGGSVDRFDMEVASQNQTKNDEYKT